MLIILWNSTLQILDTLRMTNYENGDKNWLTGSCKIACSFGFKILCLAMFGYG